MSRRPSIAVLVAMASALALAGCGGSNESGGDGAGGTSAASIDVWEVPATAECGGDTSTKVAVRYETSGASRWRLLVDGLAVEGIDEPSASLDLDVHCDALPHDFVLIAFDEAGRRTVSQKMLTTNL